MVRSPASAPLYRCTAAAPAATAAAHPAGVASPDVGQIVQVLRARLGHGFGTKAVLASLYVPWHTWLLRTVSAHPAIRAHTSTHANTVCTVTELLRQIACDGQESTGLSEQYSEGLASTRRPPERSALAVAVSRMSYSAPEVPPVLAATVSPNAASVAAASSSGYWSIACAMCLKQWFTFMPIVTLGQRIGP